MKAAPARVKTDTKPGRFCLIAREESKGRLLVGARLSATGCGRVLLVKEGRKIPFIVMGRDVFVAFSFKPGKFLSEASILTQQVLLLP